MSEVVYESRDRIAVITLNRPEVRNALNGAVAAQLHEAWKRFAESDDHVAILAGEGPNFCSGGDINDMPDNALLAMPNLSVPCNKPIIAAVSGYVVGAGSSLVMMSDICIAASDSVFIYPEAKVGAFAGLMGGFPSRMPYKAGMAWTLTGDPMDAQRAYEVGLINEVCAPSEQITRALDMASRIARNAPLVVRALKQLAQETLVKGPVENAIAHDLMLRAIRQSADYREGLVAVKERRPPEFRGE